MSKLITVNQIYEKIVPPLNKQDYSRLYESIKENGLREPIVINSNGVVLDGHNRFRICEELHKPIKTRTQTFLDNISERRYVIETNLQRRHLTDVQRYQLGGELLKLERDEANERKLSGVTLLTSESKVDKNKRTSAAKTAAAVGLTRGKFEKIDKIMKEGSEQLKQNLLEEKQSISYIYKSVNRAEKKKNSKPIPTTEFNIILADPPWQYDINTRGSPDDHYGVLTLEEICKMKVPSAKDSILFLWATAPKLKEALKVLEEWGFEYKTHMVWVKDKIGTGYYFRGQHELLLVGRKGSILIPEEKDRPSSVLIEPRTIHSKKPEKVYSLIEQMYPNHKYLELFARNKKEGWKSWGDEL